MLAVVLVAAGVAGCDGSARDEMSRDAQVYVVTIRNVVAEEPPPADPDVLPVVYVIGVGEEDIAATSAWMSAAMSSSPTPMT